MSVLLDPVFAQDPSNAAGIAGPTLADMAPSLLLAPALDVQGCAATWAVNLGHRAREPREIVSENGVKSCGRLGQEFHGPSLEPAPEGRKKHEAEPGDLWRRGLLGKLRLP